MEIPVTLVPSIDAQAWPNEIYVGYATGWMRRYDQEFDPDRSTSGRLPPTGRKNPAPQKLQPYLADAKTQVQKLLADYKEATAAPQTELIDQADRQRDALIAQVSTMIEAMLKMTLMPQKQQAAQTLKTGWDIYKPTAKAALRDESTQVQQWLEYVHAHAAQGAALAELGLTQIVADLEQQNDEVIRLMDERAAERQQQKTIVLADIGLFAPLEIAPDRLLALQFERDGMLPVTLQRRVVSDANAITLYGQRAYEANHQALDSVGLLREPLAVKEFGDVYHNITSYDVLKEMAFEGAYPTLTGFTDREAWNKVTPVVGYRFHFCDPVGLSSLKMGVGISPWSSHEWKNQLHADLEWRYYFWTLKAAWNPTCFYDLAGPLRESRKGYKVSLAYDYMNSLVAPYKRSWGFSLGAYGLMDALPLYQEIAADDIRSLQTASVYDKLSKLRKSLGAVMDEQGYQLGLQGYSYLAGGKFYPSVEATGDFGLLLPVGRNNSFWLRTAAGHNFGDSESALGNTYFGGFRNNYIDYRDVFRYRTALALPGADIDAVKAHSYAKATAELNLSPVRFNNFGALYCYPTWTQCSLFATGLSAWNDGSPRQTFVSAGVQLTTEVVFFNYLKTTLSLGYGHLFAPEGFSGGRHGNELMVSLKLL